MVGVGREGGRGNSHRCRLKVPTQECNFILFFVLSDWDSGCVVVEEPVLEQRSPLRHQHKSVLETLQQGACCCEALPPVGGEAALQQQGRGAGEGRFYTFFFLLGDVTVTCLFKTNQTTGMCVCV